MVSQIMFVNNPVVREISRPKTKNIKTSRSYFLEDSNGIR